MSKFILIILAIIVLVVGIFLWQTNFFFSSKKQATSNQAASNMEVMGEAMVAIIEEGFFPSELKIRLGGRVRFVNQSKYWHWPASDLHPTHTLYPEFDPKKTIGPGEEWSFVFEKTGEWGFHDHLAPYITGKVIVAE